MHNKGVIPSGCLSEGWWWYLKKISGSLHEAYWSEEMKIDVSTDSLALLSPKTEQYEIFPCNGSMGYKTEWDTEVNFDFVFLFSIDIRWISLPWEPQKVPYNFSMKVLYVHCIFFELSTRPIQVS